MTTAGPILAAAFAIVSRPRQLHGRLGLFPTSFAAALPMSGFGISSDLVKNNGETPTIKQEILSPKETRKVKGHGYKTK